MEILTVPAQRGTAWWKDAYAIFKRAPWVWIGMLLILVVLFLVVSGLPVIGTVAANVFQPVFIAGMLVACRESDLGKPITVDQLFAGFRSRLGPLITLGTLSLLMSAIVVGITFFAGAAGLWNKFELIKNGTLLQDPSQLLSVVVTISLVLTIGAVGFMLVTFATWFAPALVMLKGLSAVDAIKASFLGCVRNVWPLTIFSLWMIVWIVAATIPLGLGWFVLLPVIVLTEYSGFKDIYSDPS